MKRLERTATLAGLGVLLLALAPGCSNGNDNAKRTDTAPAKAYEANNTGRNAGDENRLTPMDQGTSTTDINVTQQIRQALVAEDSLSITAKNVKVITRDGKVTLRGPVVNDTERVRIEAIAIQVAGPDNVTNELELETPKS